jgi:hypothetical protein
MKIWKKLKMIWEKSEKMWMELLHPELLSVAETIDGIKKILRENPEICIPTTPKTPYRGRLGYRILGALGAGPYEKKMYEEGVRITCMSTKTQTLFTEKTILYRVPSPYGYKHLCILRREPDGSLVYDSEGSNITPHALAKMLKLYQEQIVRETYHV